MQTSILLIMFSLFIFWVMMIGTLIVVYLRVVEVVLGVGVGHSDYK